MASNLELPERSLEVARSLLQHADGLPQLALEFEVPQEDDAVGDPVSTLVGEDDDTIERALADGPSPLDDACEVSGRHAEGHAVALTVSLSEFEHRGDRFVVVLVRDERERD